VISDLRNLTMTHFRHKCHKPRHQTCRAIASTCAANETCCDDANNLSTFEWRRRRRRRGGGRESSLH